MEREIVHDTVVTGTMPATSKRVSWGAIFAGAVVALVVQLMLSVLGIGIGASTVNPLTEQNPASGLGTGAAIWFVLTSLIALFAGGWVAGRLAGAPRDADRALHGILTWGVTTLLTFYLLTTAIGGLIGGTANLLTRGMSAVNVDERTVSRAGNAANTAANQLPSEQRAREIGNDAASGVAKAGIWTFIFMLVGAIAAAVGGYASNARHDGRRVNVNTVRTT